MTNEETRLKEMAALKVTTTINQTININEDTVLKELLQKADLFGLFQEFGEFLYKSGYQQSELDNNNKYLAHKKDKNSEIGATREDVLAALEEKLRVSRLENKKEIARLTIECEHSQEAVRQSAINLERAKERIQASHIAANVYYRKCEELGNKETFK